jgi:MoaA/NifB/PqqE/SkfB family radical SAM enzyme
VEGGADSWLLVANGFVTEINRSAALMLQAAVCHPHLDAAVDSLLADFDDPRDEIRATLLSLLCDLRDEGLLDGASASLPNSDSTRRFVEGDSEWVKRIAAPIHISWHLSTACNLDCAFCYSRSSDLRPMSASQAMDCAERLVSGGVLDVSFGGGEPLLVPHLPEVAHVLCDAGINVTFTTNGGSCLRRALDSVLVLPLAQVGVSLDSATRAGHDAVRGNGAFDDAVAAARRVVESGTSLRIVTLLTSANEQEATTIAKLASRLGAAEIQFKRLRWSGIPREIASQIDVATDRRHGVWRELLDFQSQVPNTRVNIGQDNDPVVNQAFGDGRIVSCPSGAMSACLRPDGTVVACAYSGEVLGNLQCTSLRDIWHQSTAKRLNSVCSLGPL